MANSNNGAMRKTTNNSPSRHRKSFDKPDEQLFTRCGISTKPEVVLDYSTNNGTLKKTPLNSPTKTRKKSKNYGDDRRSSINSANESGKLLDIKKEEGEKYEYVYNQVDAGKRKRRNKKKKNKIVDATQNKPMKDTSEITHQEAFSPEIENQSPRVATNPKIHQKRPLHEDQLLNPLQELITKHHQIQVLKKRALKYPRALFLCKLCLYYCDSWSVVKYHIHQDRHLSAWENVAENNGIKLIPKPLPEQTIYFTQLIEKTVEMFGISNEELLVRQNIAKYINTIVEKHLEGCSIQLYGSSATGMSCCNSDVNLNLVVPSSMKGPSTLKTVFELMKQDSSNSEVELDVADSIPRVQFLNLESNLKCNICLNNSNAYDINQLISKYVSIDSRVKPLTTAFLLWANKCQLDKPELGTYPSYAFALMIIYYLQQLKDPVLPVLHELVEQESEQEKPDVYLDPSALDGLWKTSNTSTLGELWLGLFKFYILDFDMFYTYVCITSSKPLKRAAKKWSGRRLAIEDPFLPKRNVTRTMVHQSTFDYFMFCLRTTFKYCSIPQTENGPIFQRIEETPMLSISFTNIVEMITKHAEYLQVVMSQDSRFFLPGMENGSPAAVQTESCLPLQPLFKNLHCLILDKLQAELMFKQFNPVYFLYKFEEQSFRKDKKLPLVCTLCHEEGHLKGSCPEEILPPLENLPPKSNEYLQTLSAVCETIRNDCELTSQEYEMRDEIVLELEKFILKFYPDASLKLFGSSCNGFGLHKSDLDICLTFKSNESGEGLNFADLIDKLLDTLHKYPKCNNLIAITTAKVPILKLFHPDSQLEGDISLYNTLAQENTRLLKTYSEIDERVKVLVYVLKRFAKLCDICDASRGSLSSYAYVLMAIYFLQQCDPPVLPILQEIIDIEAPPSKIVDGCNTYFYDDITNLHKVWTDYGKNNSSVGALWIELLRFYTEMFNFKTDVISIRQKSQLLRFEKLWNSKFMAIEDPFDLNHNLGAGLSRKMHNFIMKAFRKGRNFFGNPKNVPDFSVSQLKNYLFNSINFTDGAPPNDRGCRNCRKIGHLYRECPLRKNKKGDRKWQEQNRKWQEQNGNVAVQEETTARSTQNQGGKPRYVRPNRNVEGNLAQGKFRYADKSGRSRRRVENRKPASPVESFGTGTNWSVDGYGASFAPPKTGPHFTGRSWQNSNRHAANVSHLKENSYVNEYIPGAHIPLLASQIDEMRTRRSQERARRFMPLNNVTLELLKPIEDEIGFHEDSDANVDLIEVTERSRR